MKQIVLNMHHLLKEDRQLEAEGKERPRIIWLIEDKEGEGGD